MVNFRAHNKIVGLYFYFFNNALEDDKPEEDEVHRLLAHLVELVEKSFDHLGELVLVERLHVQSVVVAEVAEHETSQVVLVDYSVSVAVIVLEQLVEVFVEVFLHHAAYEAHQPRSISVVHQPGK